MSDSELSDAPLSNPDFEPTPELMSEPPAYSQLSAFNGRSSVPPSSPPPALKNSASTLFTKGLFKRELTNTTPRQLQFRCTQPRCTYAPPPVALSNTQTGNLWKHYQARHAGIAFEHRSSSIPPPATSTTAQRWAFFEPRQTSHDREKRRRQLLVHCFTMNFLSFRLVESPSFIDFISYLSPSTKLLSRRSLCRDIYAEFQHHRVLLKAELQAHITIGGGLSLTTDAWSARNKDEHAAVTVHWINEMWDQRKVVLDVIYLKESHLGQYLADKLLEATNDFGITHAVRTISHDNAYANDTMLRIFETVAGEQRTTPYQPWPFNVEEGDVRCMGHIINLAVQDALKTLKADPEEDPNSWHLPQGQARIPRHAERQPQTNIADCLAKLRRHIFVFMNRKGWTRLLNEQARAASIPPIKLQLDMPVRWNSTHEMLQLALRLQVPITAACAVQDLDESMRAIRLTPPDWRTLKQLDSFFAIFDKPTRKLQGTAYPTLNMAVPLYLRMMKKLKNMRAELGPDSVIGDACTTALSKLDKYYTIASDGTASHSNVATILDPRMNLSVYDFLLPLSGQLPRRNRAKKQFEDVVSKYQQRARNIEYAAQENGEENDVLPRDIDSDDEIFTSHGRVAESETSRWYREPGPDPEKPFDLLTYWSSKQYDYPILSQMARDYLAIPATSAASERVFSNGADTVTKKRNRMAPETLRELLCLRSWGIRPEPVLEQEVEEPEQSVEE